MGRPALLLLLAATAVLYLWGLGASGWANAYCSTATQAGSQSWKALSFGSSDAANFITVEKAPAALWLMGLSARRFGVNAWSILVPQVLAGVGSVGLSQRHGAACSPPGAGLVAGAVLALTPVSVRHPDRLAAAGRPRPALGRAGDLPHGPTDEPGSCRPGVVGHPAARGRRPHPLLRRRRDDGRSSGTASRIPAWVTASFPATSVGGTALYDLTSRA